MLFLGIIILMLESPAHAQGIVLHHFYISQDTGSPVYLSAEFPNEDGLDLKQIPSLQLQLEQLAPSERLLVVKQTEAHSQSVSPQPAGLKLHTRGVLPDLASCILFSPDDIDFYGDLTVSHTLQGAINPRCSQIKMADGKTISFSSGTGTEGLYPDGLSLIEIPPREHIRQKNDHGSSGIPGVPNPTDLRELLSSSYGGPYGGGPKFDFRPGGGGLSNLMDFNVMVSLLPTAMEKRERDRPVLVLGSQDGVSVEVTDTRGHQWQQFYTMEQAGELLAGVEDGDELLSRLQGARLVVRAEKPEDLSAICRESVEKTNQLIEEWFHDDSSHLAHPQAEGEGVPGTTSFGNTITKGEKSGDTPGQKSGNEQNSSAQAPKTTKGSGCGSSIGGAGSGDGNREDEEPPSKGLETQCEASQIKSVGKKTSIQELESTDSSTELQSTINSSTKEVQTIDYSQIGGEAYSVKRTKNSKLENSIWKNSDHLYCSIISPHYFYELTGKTSGNGIAVINGQPCLVMGHFGLGKDEIILNPCLEGFESESELTLEAQVTGLKIIKKVVCELSLSDCKAVEGGPIVLQSSRLECILAGTMSSLPINRNTEYNVQIHPDDEDQETLIHGWYSLTVKIKPASCVCHDFGPFLLGGDIDSFFTVKEGHPLSIAGNKEEPIDYVKNCGLSRQCIYNGSNMIGMTAGQFRLVASGSSGNEVSPLVKIGDFYYFAYPCFYTEELYRNLQVNESFDSKSERVDVIPCDKTLSQASSCTIKLSWYKGEQRQLSMDRGQLECAVRNAMKKVPLQEGRFFSGGCSVTRQGAFFSERPSSEGLRFSCKCRCCCARGSAYCSSKHPRYSGSRR